MSFLAPYLLWGTLAAGIPVALHFFYRTRYRTVPWAAMRFLLTGLEQTSRRLRFQELLLLILRVAILVVLALALARPTGSSNRGSGRGDAVDAVFILDTSFSMDARDGAAPVEDRGDPYLRALRKVAAPDGTLTRLARAKAAALAVIDHLPPHSTVQVVSAAGRAAVLLGPEKSAQLDQARQLIEELAVSHLAVDLLSGVDEAAALLQRGNSPNKELYLFSDMQKLGWDQSGDAVSERLKEVGARATLHLVRCGSREPANVAVVGVAGPSAPRTGERADFAVLVRNSSKETVRDLTVFLEVDGKTKERDAKALASLAPGETRALVLGGRLEKAGRRVVTATVQSDDLPADNRFDQVIQVRDQVGVLVVDGSPNELDPSASASYYLVNALYPVPVEVVTPARASARHLANKDLCVLVDVALTSRSPTGPEALNPEFLDSLAAYVREGHGLMIFAGEHVEPARYNRLLNAQHRLLPLKLGEKQDAPADRPLQLDRASAAGPFQKFRQAEEYKIIDLVEVRRLITVEEPAKAAEPTASPEVQVHLRTSDGRPVVVSRKRPGEGEVLFFTTSANDLRWTDWPLYPAFVPLVQASLNHLLQGQPQAFNRTAGEPLRWYPPDQGGGKGFVLLPPAGRKVRLGYPKMEEGRPVVETDGTRQAGVYRIALADEPPAEDGELPGVPFAVVPDLRESEDLEALAEPQLKERLGVPAVYLTAGDDKTALSGVERLHREWTTWLFLALLGMVVGESLLAWVCGRAW